MHVALWDCRKARAIALEQPKSWDLSYSLGGRVIFRMFLMVADLNIPSIQSGLPRIPEM